MGKYIHIDKNLLKDLYFKQKLSLKQISKRLNINSSTIEARLKEFGFKLRNKFEAKKLINQSGQNNPFYKKGKPHCIDCGKKLSRYDAKRCINCYIKIAGFSNKGLKRSIETKKKCSLAKGGTGIPYEDTLYPKEFHYIRIEIRERDNYTCIICGNFGKVVHHIDYDKNNSNNGNLITLCLRCHRETNFNRNYWQQYFHKKINYGKKINLTK